VALAPLLLDGVEYMMAVWPGTADDGLPCLADLASDLGAVLLGGQVKAETVSE
jgi:hypothetical protein